MTAPLLRPPRRPAPRRTFGLVLTGSLRQESTTRALAEELVTQQPWLRLGPSLDRLPHFDADLEALALPAAAGELRDAVADASLVVLVTPDYDGRVPGLIGNTIDWLTRTGPRRRGSEPPPLTGKPCVVVGLGQESAERLALDLERVGARLLAPPVVAAGQAVPASLSDLAARTRAWRRAHHPQVSTAA